MLRVLWWSYGGGLFLISEVPLHDTTTGLPTPRRFCQFLRRDSEASGYGWIIGSPSERFVSSLVSKICILEGYLADEKQPPL